MQCLFLANSPTLENSMRNLGKATLKVERMLLDFLILCFRAS